MMALRRLPVVENQGGLFGLVMEPSTLARAVEPRAKAFRGNAGRIARPRTRLKPEEAVQSLLSVEVDDDGVLAELETWRPKTREDCGPARDVLTGSPRGECPYRGCKFNLLADVDDEGTIVEVEPGPDENGHARPSCVLDVVEDHPDGLDSESIARALGVTGDRVLFIVGSAAEQLSKHGLLQKWRGFEAARDTTWSDLGESSDDEE